MKPNTIKLATVVAISAGSIALLGACAAPSSNGTNTVVTAGATASRTVAVNGVGTAEITPDLATVNLSVYAEKPTAEEATAAAAATADKVLTSLKDSGVAEEDIATQSINVQPVYDYPADGIQTLRGYAANQSFTVKLRDLDTAGKTIDAAVAAGENQVRIDGTSLSASDPLAGTAEARAKAVESAKAKAQQYADLMGFELGEVATVSEGVSQTATPAPMYASAAEAAAPKETQILPGTQQVTVSVDVTYLIG